MYIPSYYRVEDRERIAQILTDYPFGVLVAVRDGRPEAVHIPFEWRQIAGQLALEGHVAEANRLWQFAPETSEVLVIFQGPHTYVSPSWYTDPNVPTWNYLAVHVYGTCRTMDQPELEAFLERLVNRYEAKRDNGRPWANLPGSLRDSQMRGIVGLRIDVTRIEAAAKMSQNRTDRDFRRIVQHLSASASSHDNQVAEVMQDVRPELFDPLNASAEDSHSE